MPLQDAPPLGKRISSYHGERKLRTAWPYPLVASLLLALLLSGAAGQSSLWLILAVSAICFLVLATINHYGNWRFVVHLHQHGFLVDRNGQVYSFLWPEISEIYLLPMRQGNDPRRRWKLKICTIDGQKLKLQGFDGVESLGRRAHQMMVQRLLPRISAAYQRGSWVQFGRKISVSNVGLHFGAKTISWPEINDIAVDQVDGVRVYCGANATLTNHLPISSVANLELFSQFVAWIESNYLDQQVHGFESESELIDRRAIGVSEQFSGSDYDVNDLIRSGFEWEEINEVISGDRSIDELLDRGPRRRFRYPK